MCNGDVTPTKPRSPLWAPCTHGVVATKPNPPLLVQFVFPIVPREWKIITRQVTTTTGFDETLQRVRIGVLTLHIICLRGQCDPEIGFAYWRREPVRR